MYSLNFEGVSAGRAPGGEAMSHVTLSLTRKERTEDLTITMEPAEAFDLGNRLIHYAKWCREQPPRGSLSAGFLGSNGTEH